MDPAAFRRAVVRPGLHQLEAGGGPAITRAAERFLIAIALQESEATARYQHSPAQVPGPARGFWQFEIAGVLGVLNHSSTSVLAAEAVKRAEVVLQEAAVHRAIEGHDALAVAFARLLILTHPQPLPETEEQGWQQYLSLWRPGRPRREKWPRCWERASEATLPDADTGTARTA